MKQKLKQKLKLAKLSKPTISQEANIFATHTHRHKQSYYHSYFFTITIPNNVEPDVVMQRFQIAAHKITKGNYDYVGMFCSTDIRSKVKATRPHQGNLHFHIILYTKFKLYHYTNIYNMEFSKVWDLSLLVRGYLLDGHHNIHKVYRSTQDNKKEIARKAQHITDEFEDSVKLTKEELLEEGFIVPIGNKEYRYNEDYIALTHITQKEQEQKSQRAHKKIKEVKELKQQVVKTIIKKVRSTKRAKVKIIHKLYIQKEKSMDMIIQKNHRALNAIVEDSNKKLIIQNRIKSTNEYFKKNLEYDDPYNKTLNNINDLLEELDL